MDARRRGRQICKILSRWNGGVELWLGGWSSDEWARANGVYTGSILKGAKRRTCRSCNRAGSNSSSTPRPPGCSASESWEDEQHVMQSRSIRRSGQPTRASASRMRAFSCDLIRRGHYGQRSMRTALHRKNTWPHRPSLRRADFPCQPEPFG
jgi:hypothetical protein